MALKSFNTLILWASILGLAALSAAGCGGNSEASRDQSGPSAQAGQNSYLKAHPEQQKAAPK